MVTHAHGDHARPGNRHYWVAQPGLELARKRLGTVPIDGLAYGERVRFGAVDVSLHPAGHVLGSAQVRIEGDGGVWVVSGDYKRTPDPTCAPFEVLPCDTFVTEATFASPAYCWPDSAAVVADVHAWWRHNAARDRAAVLFCYSLGKAQRVLAHLTAHAPGPVYLHGAMTALTEIYRRAGVSMVETRPVASRGRTDPLAGELVLAPPSAAGSRWARRFRDAETGFASGWMRIRGNRRRQGWDRGFVLSDHADWPELLDTIRGTGAARVIAMHGDTDVLCRYLAEQGVRAEPIETALPQAH